MKYCPRCGSALKEEVKEQLGEMEPTYEIHCNACGDFTIIWSWPNS